MVDIGPRPPAEKQESIPEGKLQSNEALIEDKFVFECFCRRYPSTQFLLTYQNIFVFYKGAAVAGSPLFE